MATRTNEGAQVKERSSRSPLTPQSPHGRTTKSSSTSRSPDRDVPTRPGKSIPNYLKPTVSSCNEAPKPGKKQSSGGTSRTAAVSTRKSTDKPPSPSSQPQRTSSFNSRKEVVILKPLSPWPRTSVSQKPISERSSKTQRTGKTLPFAKAESPQKGKGSARGKEASASATTSAATSPEVTGTPAVEPAKEVVEFTPDVVVQNVEDEERILLEIPPTHHDQTPDEPTYSKKPEEEEDSTQSMEEHGVNPTAQAVEVDKGENATNNEKDGDNDNDDEQFEQYSEATRPVQVPVEASGEQGNAEKPITENGKATPEGSGGDENAPEKLKLRRGNDIGDGGCNEREGSGGEGDAEGEEDAKENVVLKRQAVHGKEAPPAYNDVIKVTASKLVEKRKSRVKALVGAFETVISLQEPEGTQGQQPPPAEDADKTTNESIAS